MQHIKRISVCKYLNRVHLLMQRYGYAIVDTTWKGTVANPGYSRLFYVKSGSGIITTENHGTLVLNAGQWYLVPARCSFKYGGAEQMEHIYFHLKLCDFDEIDLLSSALRPLSLSLPTDFSDTLVSYIIQDDLQSGLWVKQVAYQAVLHFIAQYGIAVERSDYSPCVYHALHYIKQNLSVKLTIPEIAENVFVSKSTLTKRFKQEIGMSVNQYIYDTVMSEAGRMLLTGNVSVLAVSEKFGFSDQFYLSRRFKEKFGVSPRDYRKTMFI